MKAIFPGTFSIFHEGHIDILKRALKIFDFIYILVAINPNKEQDNLNERYEKVKSKIFDIGIENVVVVKWDSKISYFAQKNSTYFIIRGIRDEKDFQFEKEIGRIYKKEFDKLDVVYFLANESLEMISSRKLKKELKKEKI